MKIKRRYESLNLISMSFKLFSDFFSTFNLAVDTIFKSNPNHKISKKDLKILFEFETKGTHFSFEGDIYDQIDGVVMGSPLAPALANLFMSPYETKWLQNEKARDVVHYKRYVDDIFVFLKQKSKLKNLIVSLIVNILT